MLCWLYTLPEKTSIYTHNSTVVKQIKRVTLSSVFYQFFIVVQNVIHLLCSLHTGKNFCIEYSKQKLESVR